MAGLLFIVALLACSTQPQPVSGVPEGPPEKPEFAEPEPLEDVGSTQSILTRVAVLLEQNDHAGAIALFDEIEEPERESSRIQLLKASILLSAGRLEEGRAVVQAVLSNDSENPDALFVLSSFESAEGKTREQRRLLEQIISIQPGHVEALAALGTMFLGNRSYKNAASYFDRALETDPEYGEALVGRAEVHRYQRDPQKAEALLNKAVALYPQWEASWSSRARLYREIGALPQALADLNAAKIIAPGSYWISCDRGTVLLDMGRKPEALEEFQRAISLGPDNFVAYVYSAGIKDDLKDYAGAEQDYRAVIRLKPAYYFAFEGLGMLMMRRGAWGEARAAFQEAYNAAPQETAYALLAAANWIRTGTPQDLKQFLQSAIRRVQRETLEWYVMRLYYDLSGDGDVAMRIERERDLDMKQKMLFYLALYYDARNNRALADRYYLQVKEMGRPGTLEWRINEWTLQERNLNVH
jgi:tetratricopeptide (TPR) repeat protein